MFPRDGRCKTFDAAADGFCRGEGSVAVALRGWRLATPLASEGADDGEAKALIVASAATHKGGGASLRGAETAGAAWRQLRSLDQSRSQ